MVMEASPSFDMTPMKDGSGYRITICTNQHCCEAFVSSIHLTEDKRSQLISCVQRTSTSV